MREILKDSFRKGNKISMGNTKAILTNSFESIVKNKYNNKLYFP